MPQAVRRLPSARKNQSGPGLAQGVLTAAFRWTLPLHQGGPSLATSRRLALALDTSPPLAPWWHPRSACIWAFVPPCRLLTAVPCSLPSGLCHSSDRLSTPFLPSQVLSQELQSEGAEKEG